MYIWGFFLLVGIVGNSGLWGECSLYWINGVFKG